LVAALAVVLVVISGFVYWVLATLNPDIGLGGLLGVMFAVRLGLGGGRGNGGGSLLR